MPQNLEKALDEFKKKRILVLGDIFLDKFSFGKVNRVNPEQPAAHLVKITGERYVLGGAANVAGNITSLEAKCCLYGILRGDNYQNEIKKRVASSLTCD